MTDKRNWTIAQTANEIIYMIGSRIKLLGMEADNNTDMGYCTDNKQAASNGRILVFTLKKDPKRKS